MLKPTENGMYNVLQP